MEETEEFIALQKELLRHKFLYHIQKTPEITDYDYDVLERKSFEMAKSLGYRADSYLGPEINEIEHVHWLVGYNEHNPYNER